MIIIYVATTLILASPIIAYVIAQSQVESCIRRSSGLSCSLSLLINSVVTSGSNGTESILVSSVLDQTGQLRNLTNPIMVNVTKGPVFVRYSLVYLVDVNSKPREVVSTTSLLGCASDTTQLGSNPTCGYLYYRASRIRYSEGFCCKCSLDQLLGLGSHQRGGVQCNLLTSLFSNGASVHCLRWGPIWYSLFRIMTPAIESSVWVTFGDGSVDSQTRLILTAQNPVVSSLSSNNSLNVTARLVGSFAWTRPPTDWGLQMYAASPNVAASTSASALTDPRIKSSSPLDPFRYGMLVPMANVDLSGDTCNKIGVSFSGFVNNQGDRCSAYVGDCLQNQLDDCWSALTTKSTIKPGVNTCMNVQDSLCASIGGTFVQNDGYRLSCVLSDTSADSPTQVLIQLNAKDVAIVRNDAIGVIISVSVETNVALTQTANVEVIVRNTGDLQSEFLISVRDCLPDGLLLPLSGSDISLGPNATALVQIKVEDSSITGNMYACTAAMTDASGLQLSVKNFVFNTTDLLSSRGSQSTDNSTGLADGEGGPSVESEGVQDTCSSSCSSFFDVVCFVSNACWSKLGSLAGTIAGVGTFLTLMTKFGGWQFMLGACKTICCCTGSSKSKRKRRMSDTEYVGNTQDNIQRYHNMHPMDARSYPFNPYWLPTQANGH
jgi:hypothetical protein